MNAAILNRQFKHPEDGWYHVEPKGNHPNTDAGVIQLIDDEACTSIVNRFNDGADAGTLSHGHEMLIDHEHFKHNGEKETLAFGWLTRLQNRADGYYGQIRWSNTGKAAVDGGDYRFFSTEYPPAECVVVKNKAIKGAKLLRPMELSGLTLTNMPNNKGGRPITNRTNLPGNQATDPAGNKAEIQNRKQQMKQIATRLGLDPEASEDGILGAITKLFNRTETAEGKITPLTTELTTLKNRLTTLDEENAESLLDAHGIEADAADRPMLKAGLIQNRETGLAWLKRIAAQGNQQQQEQKPLTNRTIAQVPAGKPGAAATEKATQHKQANAIMNRAKELRKEMPSLSPATAVAMAQGEIE